MVEGDVKVNQFINKFVIFFIEGKIFGYVIDINVEVEGNKFYFILKMKEVENFGSGQSVFISERKFKISFDDIVNVGFYVIIFGNGKVLLFCEIERFYQIVEEYNNFVLEFEVKEKLIEEFKEENYCFKREFEEFQCEFRKY